MLRRSTGSLADASEGELGRYLSVLEPEQMRGVVSNVKGIFHEMIVAAAENTDGDDISAILFDATNYPGADIEFMMNGETIGEVQLKAVQSPAAIIEHFARYPDVDVLATTEVVEVLSDVFKGRLTSSEFSNEELNATTTSTLNALTGEDFGDFIEDGLITSGLITGALQVRALLSGEGIDVKQFRSYAELAGISAGTALAVDTVLDLL